jgi:hypothetical protein
VTAFSDTAPTTSTMNQSCGFTSGLSVEAADIMCVSFDEVDWKYHVNSQDLPSSVGCLFGGLEYCKAKTKIRCAEGI